MTPNLILSLFPGIDLLGMGFEVAGYCVLRGPDPLFAGDIRAFHPPRDVCEGIIGGSPCQDFSRLRRTAPSGEGVEMVGHFHRCVTEAQPTWFLLENVPGVPALSIEGYRVQRMHVRASEFGAAQHRLRIFQFGYCDGMPLILRRPVAKAVATEPAALASAGKSINRKGWVEFCISQGLWPAPELESFTQAGRYQAVGNGVHVAVAKSIAQAIRIRSKNITYSRTDAFNWKRQEPCACECGRPVVGRQFATAACRKRAQRTRDMATTGATWSVTRDPAPVTAPGPVTSGEARA